MKPSNMKAAKISVKISTVSVAPPSDFENSNIESEHKSY